MKYIGKIPLLICMYLSFVATARSSSEAPAQAAAKNYNTLAFDEQFTSLINICEYEIGCKWYNDLWYRPKSDEKLFSVRDGKLHLTTGAGKDSSTSITTMSRDGRSGSFFRFGYFEARLKFNANDPNNFSAFWLFPVQHVRELDEDHWCEIDIVEAYRPDIFLGTVHDWTPHNDRLNSNHIYRLKENLGNNWHIYGLLWSDEKIIWYLDNMQMIVYDTPDICKRQDMFIILGAQRRNTIGNQELLVDWVKVWQ